MLAAKTSSSFVNLGSASYTTSPKFSPSMRHLKNRRYLYISCCTGNLLAICVGLCFGWSSPYLPKLKEDNFLAENPLGRPITSNEASWIGSMMPLGAMIGSMLAMYSVERYGRKKAMLFFSAIPFIIKDTILTFADTIYMFYAARVIGGVALSGVYTVVPMYLAEIAEDDVRGMICSSIFVFETLGELIIYVIGPFVSICFSALVGLGLSGFSAISVILFLPESPYFFLTMNQRENAEKALMKLRTATKTEVAPELAFMQEIVQESLSATGRCVDLCLTKAARRAETIILGLTVFQHWSGIVPILIYSQSIFEETASDRPAHMCTIAVGGVQFLASFVAPNFVDRLGRRLMLFMSAFGLCLSQTTLGFYFYLKETGQDMTSVDWLPVTCLIFYIISYISGVGPLIWTLLGELFPPHLRPPAFGLEVCWWWLMGFTVSRAYHPISILVGMNGVFWVFAGCCFIGMFFILIFVFETKGKNFHEIQAILNK